MPSSVLILHDLRNYKSGSGPDGIKHLVYIDPADQVREMKKLFEVCKEVDLYRVHFGLSDFTIPEYEGGNGYSDSEDECDSCGRSCNCNKKDPPRKWTKEEHLVEIDRYLSEWDLSTPENWLKMLEYIVASEILEDKIEFHWGTLLQAGEEVPEDTKEETQPVADDESGDEAPEEDDE